MQQIRKLTIIVLTLFTLFSVFLVNLPVYANTSLDKTLVAHYKFDQDFNDSSGLNHDGMKIGNISFENGVSGKAAKFDGESYIEVEDSDDLDFETGFTFSVWVYKEDIRPLTRQPILSKLAGEIDYYPYAFVDDDYYPGVKIVDQYGNTSTVYSQAKADFQKWQLLTATFDGKTVKFYQNGVLKDNTAFPSVLPISNGNLYIGSDIDGETTFFKGLMDDLRIYNYALTPTEVEVIYKEIALGTGKDLINKPAKMVAYYKFDNDFKDYSEFKNDGVVMGGGNGITFTTGKKDKAIKLDGNSYIEVKDSDSLDLDKAYTFTGWFYKDADQYNQPILSKLRSSIDEGYPSYSLIDNENYPGVVLFDQYTNFSTIYSDEEIGIQEWYFLAVTYDGKNVKIYHNGALKGNEPFESPMPYSSGELLIGSIITGETSFFKGMMDELRIYNYTLSPEEIKALYNFNGQQQSADSIQFQLDNPKMIVGGEIKEIDPGRSTAPIIVNGRTLVPIRALVESLGGTVGWDGAEEKITIEMEETVINLWLNKTIATVNGTERTLDVAPQSINERTMLPVRFVSENLGFLVEWNAELRQLTITKPEGGGDW